jgi:hypothetical protein
MKPGPLPADAEGTKRLQARLASLVIPAPKAAASARIPKEAAGKAFTFAANDQKVEAVGLEFGAGGDGVTLVGRFNGGAEQRIACGDGEWKKGRFAFGRLAAQPAAACGAWTADGTYTAKVCFSETPFVVTVRLDFSEGKLRLEPSWNVSFGAVRPGPLTGEPK